MTRIIDNTPTIPDELLELAELELERWPALRVEARRSGLVCEGEGDGGGGDGGGEGDGGKGGKEGDGDGKEADAGGDELAAAKARAEKAEKAAADKDKELRDRKRSDEERERAEREAGGKFDELYQAERQRADGLEKENAELKAELEKERGERKTDSARSLALDALTKAGVRNPSREVVHLDLSKIDGEAAAKRVATKFVEENPDLIDKAPTRQKRGAGSSDEGDGGDNGKAAIGPARLRKHFSSQGSGG